MAQKRGFNEGKRHFKKNKKQKTSTVTEGSNEDVLLADVRALLRGSRLSDASEEQEPPKEQTEVDLDITELSSSGDGLAYKDGQVYVVPFSAPGDTVTGKVYRHVPDQSYALADFVKVVKPSEHRTETPPCPYFTKCSGCQFQALNYDYQLAHKRAIVEKAYRNFSKLPAHLIPDVRATCGSPLQYGYRTKLTPHFDGPPGGRRDRRNGEKPKWDEVPPIGFMLKGTRKTLDIEDCPIGTEAVRKGMKSERKRVADNIDLYQRGATLLLRESTVRLDKNKDESPEQKADDTAVTEDRGDHIHRKTCITDQKAISSEYIDDFRLDNPAGAFFQNNNSILPLVTQYIRDNILGPQTPDNDSPSPIKNLIDAYCGSGFFTINLSSMFKTSIGIDISGQSVDFATKNAKLNNLSSGTIRFVAGDANSLFDAFSHKDFPPDETAVVIDPPRKGCDEGFISQLMDYAPKRLCYVSCNVHTQARDVGWLVGGLGKREGLYEIESLRGFDFFPQTSHVEGVAILRRKEKAANEENSVGAEATRGAEKVDDVAVSVDAGDEKASGAEAVSGTPADGSI